MMESRFPVIVFVAIAMGGLCGRGGMVDTVSPVLSTERLYYHDEPGIQEPVRRVIRDPGSFQRLWEQATSTQPSPPRLPAVDFRSEMVIAVGANRMSAGDLIRVDSAGVRGDIYVVVYRKILECERVDIPTYPLEIVRTRRTDDLPVDWVERTERAAHCVGGP